MKVEDLIKSHEMLSQRYAEAKRLAIDIENGELSGDVNAAWHDSNLAAQRLQDFLNEEVNFT